MSEEQKKDILNQKVDEEQLDQVGGGTAFTAVVYEEKCTNISKRSDCAATVEMSSRCWSNDACMLWDCKYDGCKTATADPDL